MSKAIQLPEGLSRHQEHWILDLITEHRRSLQQLANSPTGLRDQFAMAALQGVLSNPSGGINENNIQDLPKNCYITADAMLEARKVNNDT